MNKKKKEKIFKKLTKEMIKQAVDCALQKMDRAFESGAFNINDYNVDYELPKIVATALLEEGVYQITPLYKENQKVLKNLRKMI